MNFMSSQTMAVFCSFVFSIYTGIAIASPLPKILLDDAIKQQHYLPDFSYAGYGFGVASPPLFTKATQISVATFGAVANDDIDDTKAVLAALAKANATKGPVILAFPSGRFILSEVLHVQRDNIVIRGAGRGKAGTVLYFPRPLRITGDGGRLDELRSYLVSNNKREINKENNINVPFSEYSWSGGFIWVAPKHDRTQRELIDTYQEAPESISNIVQGLRGSRELLVQNASKLSENMTISINWRNSDGKNAPIIDALYGNTKLDIGSRHWDRPHRPIVKQRTKILSVDGKKVIIGSPLLHDINADLTADIEEWDTLTNVGVEDIRIEFPHSAYFGLHVEEGYNGIFFTGVFDGWIHNVTIENADSGVITGNSANVTIKDIMTLGQHTAHYAVQIGNAHNILVEKLNIFNPVLYSLSFNTLATGSVYKDIHVFSSPTLDQHAGANHQNLFDNVTLRIDALEDKKGMPYYPVYDGSGAPYWQPGHGGFNTTWNLKVLVESGSTADQTVRIEGLAEGPMARIIGLSGNRQFELDYRPEPYA